MSNDERIARLLDQLEEAKLDSDIERIRKKLQVLGYQQS